MSNLKTVFDKLQPIMQKVSGGLIVKKDDDSNYYLNTPLKEGGDELFFGAVQIKKNYVSYHLMPVYIDPTLLNGISPELKKKMQGKSCFNFKKVDDKLFEELETLTKRCKGELV